MAYEYNELFQIDEPSPKRAKKKPKLLEWAKKALKLDKKSKKNKGYINSDGALQREPDEQFKISNLNEIVSSPLTLRVFFVYHYES